MEVFIIVFIVGLALVVFVLVSNDNQHSSSPKKTGARRSTDRKLPPVVRENRKPVRRATTNNLPAMPRNMTLSGKAYIIDGDTIVIQGIKVRLAGIDAPEINMPWGQKSKWAMVAICKGQIVTAELDGERSFDRLVGTCFLPDRRDIGAELIKQGLALDLPEFSSGKYRHLEPDGARRKLRNGMYGHASIRVTRHTQIRIQKN